MQTRSIILTLLISVLALSVTSCTRIPAATPATAKVTNASKTGFMGPRTGLFRRKTEALPKALPLRRISTHRGSTCPTPNLRTTLARSKRAQLKKK